MFDDYKSIKEDTFNDILMESIVDAIYNDDIEKIYIKRAGGGYFRDLNGRIISRRGLVKDGPFFDEDMYGALTGTTIQAVRRLIPSKTLLVEFSNKTL